MCVYCCKHTELFWYSHTVKPLGDCLKQNLRNCFTFIPTSRLLWNIHLEHPDCWESILLLSNFRECFHPFWSNPCNPSCGIAIKMELKSSPLPLSMPQFASWSPLLFTFPLCNHTAHCSLITFNKTIIILNSFVKTWFWSWTSDDEDQPSTYYN